ncbi:MAG: T9SS type A sorting domain-containing protein [Sphingobacteriaceae bacterium]|nr:T9SS type A sorting domain-containing protein [Sphingobacteriaceae bacterium]
MKKNRPGIYVSFKKQLRYFSFGALLISGLPAISQQLAFPTAEGFGRFATGGRGGTVYKVTNLNDSGPGSLRDAVSQPNRTVVFTVGGLITITSRIIVKNNITIAGQTAPGQGICVYGDGFAFSGANNTIVRHIRIRMGINGESGKDAIAIAHGNNMMFDHVSVSWGRDGTIDVNPDSGAQIFNLTFQNCIIAQGLQTHSTGGLMQSTGGVSILRSLYIDNNSRNPKVKGVNQFVNNVIYNWVASAYIEGDSDGLSEANATNNYFIKGPNSSAQPFSGGNANFNIYASNNYYDSNVDGVLNGAVLSQASYGPVTWKTTPFAYPTVTQMTPQASYSYVIANAGYNKSRDKTDTRLLQELQSVGTIGQTISNENNAPMNGVGTISGGTAPADSDNDGMANDWETAAGTNPSVADNNGNIDGDGYTNLEEYLNYLTGENPLPGASITIQENTTGFCSVQGTVDNNNAGFTGTGFANANNALNAGVTWRINVPAAGTYTLAWRHANGGGTNRPGRLLVNGTQVVATIDFNATTNWTTWTEVSISMALSAGQNTIRLEGTTASGLSNIDYLKVTGNNPTVLSCSGVTMGINEGNSLSLAVLGAEVKAKASSVYPNPSSGAFTLSSDGKFEYVIFDQQGRELEKGKAEDEIKTGANLTAGSYFIRILKEGTSESFKVIKQ